MRSTALSSSRWPRWPQCSRRRHGRCVPGGGWARRDQARFFDDSRQVREAGSGACARRGSRATRRSPDRGKVSIIRLQVGKDVDDALDRYSTSSRRRLRGARISSPPRRSRRHANDPTTARNTGSRRVERDRRVGRLPGFVLGKAPARRSRSSTRASTRRAPRSQRAPRTRLGSELPLGRLRRLRLGRRRQRPRNPRRRHRCGAHEQQSDGIAGSRSTRRSSR